MTDSEIVAHIQRLFEPTVSPGQAFDALFKMRQERVMWTDVVRAVRTNGSARVVRQRLDEDEDGKPFECPGCGVSRENREYCINPDCSEYKPNPETDRIRRESRDPKFKNPKPTFGKYKDKTLLEIAAINPGYLAWMARDHESEFWREQAKLAQIAAEVTAPIARDTSDTGFFG